MTLNNSTESQIILKM